jgi:ComF family protein
LKFLEATVALGVYEEPLRSVIHKLKYGNGWRLSRLLGPMLATRLAPFIGRERPLVAHVPMHERKRRVKGYDHARELAECLARSLGLDHRPLLERVRFTASQASLERKGRRTNVAGAFKLKEEWVEETAGRRVVLVDDVLTTGSTVSECARVLVEGGAAGVTACILARDLKAGCGEP